MERVYPCYLWVRYFNYGEFEIGVMINSESILLAGSDFKYPSAAFVEIGDVVEVPEKYRRHD